MSAPKVMLHPVNTKKLRGERQHISANVAGYISWRRLVEALRKSGEFRSGEDVEAFVVDDDGIQFYVSGP